SRSLDPQLFLSRPPADGLRIRSGGRAKRPRRAKYRSGTIRARLARRSHGAELRQGRSKVVGLCVDKDRYCSNSSDAPRSPFASAARTYERCPRLMLTAQPWMYSARSSAATTAGTQERRLLDFNVEKRCPPERRLLGD